MSICFVTRSSLGEEYLASERLRCEWLLPHLDGVKWSGEDLSKYDAVVYSKADPVSAPVPDDPMCERPRILDMCDPVWRTNSHAVDVALGRVDMVTVPTESMRVEFSNRMCNFPCHVVHDGHDLTWYPIRPKTGPVYVWFGYSRNYNRVADHLLNLAKDARVVSDICFGDFDSHEWKDDLEAFSAISECKVAIIPHGDPLKSNNRAISAWAMGLAVARNTADLERFQDVGERQQDIEDHLPEVWAHSARHAAGDLMRVINEGRPSGRLAGGPIPPAPRLNYEQSRIPSP